MMAAEATIPRFLERPDIDGGFGTLALAPDGSRWVFEGEAHVAQAAKRLFPSADGRGAGRAQFPVTRRTFADLVWLMQRYPMRVDEASRAAWERHYRDACAHAVERERIARSPLAAVPGALFRGEARGYQREGLAWMMANRRTLLADDMGLGKTVQAILLLATLKQWPALIVPPPNLVTQWVEMLKVFLPATDEAPDLFGGGRESLRIHAIRDGGLKKGVQGGGQKLPDAHIIVCHYLLLQKWRERFGRLAPPVVIFDEIQELRHGGTQKYSAAVSVSQAADTVVGLSGTPIYNYGIEIWHVLNAIEFHALGDMESFTKEWCDGYGSRIVQDPAALGAHLRREGLMLRRRKTDVARELPPKHRAVHRVDADDGRFRAAMGKVLDLVQAYGETADRAKRYVLKGRIDRETRRATGIAKAPAAGTFIAGLVEAGDPVLVFAHHHAVVDILMRQLGPAKPVCITGRQDTAEKEASKRAFIGGEARVCIVGLRAGAGIDGLQKRARIVVFAELDWSPQVHAQCEDRLHRDGQGGAVLCYYLLSSLGSDPEMEDKLGLKIAQAKGILDDPPESADRQAADEQATDDHIGRMIARLAEKAGTGGAALVEAALSAADGDALDDGIDDLIGEDA